jgi:hypothetical protein
MTRIKLAGFPILAAAALALLPLRAAEAQPAPTALDYDILHSGSVIGYEHMVFRQEGETLAVHTVVAMKVDALFVTVFRFEQTRDETWQKEKLVSFAAVTNDNGTHYNVKGEAGPDGIKITSDAKSWLLPPDSVPLTFWHTSSVTGKGPLFDVETGKLLGVDPAKLGEESVSLGGKTVPTTHYRIKWERTDDLWYDGGGRLVKAIMADKNGEAEWIAK